MRGVVIQEFGPLNTHKLEEVPEPKPGPEEVLVDVHAIGVNYPDTLMMKGLYQTKPPRPFVPGRDAAGMVTAVGEKITRVKVGDRIAVVVPFGAYAEQVVAPESRCFPLPDNVDFVTGAGMTTIYFTAYVSLMLPGQYKPGETVLVLGASGGVGLAAVQLAKAKGATVLAAGTSKERLELTKANGADHTIDISGDDLRESLRDQVFAVTDGRGVDIVLDPVGGDVFDAAIRTLAFAGRIVAIGFAAGRIPEVKAGYLNVKNVTVAGVSLDQHFRNVPETMEKVVADVMDMCTKGEIRPEITATYPLESFQSAIGVFGERKAVGKVVLTTGKDQ